MLEKLDVLLAEVTKARDEAGKPKGEAGEVVDRRSQDEFNRAASHLEEARNWLEIHDYRLANK